MILSIESTAEIVSVDGVKCRVWRGTTPRGVPVSVLVHRVRVSNSDDASELERELAWVDSPTDAIARALGIDPEPVR